MSLMPAMKSLFSDKQIEQMITFVETRSGKSGLLRYAGQIYSKRIVLANQGFPPPYTGFQGAHKPIVPEGNERIPKVPEGQLEEAPNLAQIDRGYWLSGNPLPVTEQNLSRGKTIFLQRCVGCHGIAGDGKGPGARSCLPRPPTSPTRTTPAAAATPGRATSTTASCAAGPAPGWRTSATASRSTTSGGSCSSSRRSPTRRWPRTTSRSRRSTSPGSRANELLAWVKSRQKLETNVSFVKAPVIDPYMQEAMRVMPGLAAGDSFTINDGKTLLSLDEAAAAIKTIYQQLLERGVGRRAGARRPAAAGLAEGHSPDRAGAAVRATCGIARRCPGACWRSRPSRLPTMHRRARSRTG